MTELWERIFLDECRSDNSIMSWCVRGGSVCGCVRVWERERSVSERDKSQPTEDSGREKDNRVTYHHHQHRSTATELTIFLILNFSSWSRVSFLPQIPFIPESARDQKTIFTFHSKHPQWKKFPFSLFCTFATTSDISSSNNFNLCDLFEWM